MAENIKLMEQANAMLRDRLAISKELFDLNNRTASREDDQYSALRMQAELRQQAYETTKAQVDLMLQSEEALQTNIASLEAQTGIRTAAQEQELELLRETLRMRQEEPEALDKSIAKLRQKVATQKESASAAEQQRKFVEEEAGAWGKNLANAMGFRKEQDSMLKKFIQSKNKIKAMTNAMKAFAKQISLAQIGTKIMQSAFQVLTGVLTKLFGSKGGGGGANIHQFVKMTGHATDGLAKMAKEAGRLGKKLKVGFDEGAKAVGTLMDGVTGFMHMSTKTQKGLATMAVKMSAFNVEADLTAGILDQMMTRWGKTGDQATKAMMKMYNSAVKLGVPISKYMEDFEEFAKSVPSDGRDIEVRFRKMAAATKELGLNLKDVLGLAKGFETFEDATRGAAQMNQILGKAVYNNVELMKAANESPEEFANKMNEGLKKAGKSWSDLTVYQKKAMAKEMKMDISEAEKLFGGAKGGGLTRVQKAQRSVQNITGAVKQFNEALRRTKPPGGGGGKDFWSMVLKEYNEITGGKFFRKLRVAKKGLKEIVAATSRFVACWIRKIEKWFINAATGFISAFEGAINWIGEKFGNPDLVNNMRKWVAEIDGWGPVLIPVLALVGGGLVKIAGVAATLTGAVTTLGVSFITSLGPVPKLLGAMRDRAGSFMDAFRGGGGILQKMKKGWGALMGHTDSTSMEALARKAQAVRIVGPLRGNSVAVDEEGILGDAAATAGTGLAAAQSPASLAAQAHTANTIRGASGGAKAWASMKAVPAGYRAARAGFQGAEFLPGGRLQGVIAGLKGIGPAMREARTMADQRATFEQLTRLRAEAKLIEEAGGAAEYKKLGFFHRRAALKQAMGAMDTVGDVRGAGSAAGPMADFQRAFQGAKIAPGMADEYMRLRAGIPASSGTIIGGGPATAGVKGLSHADALAEMAKFGDEVAAGAKEVGKLGRMFGTVGTVVGKILGPLGVFLGALEGAMNIYDAFAGPEFDGWKLTEGIADIVATVAMFAFPVGTIASAVYGLGKIIWKWGDYHEKVMVDQKMWEATRSDTMKTLLAGEKRRYGGLNAVHKQVVSDIISRTGGRREFGEGTMGGAAVARNIRSRMGEDFAQGIETKKGRLDELVNLEGADKTDLLQLFKREGDSAGYEASAMDNILVAEQKLNAARKRLASRQKGSFDDQRKEIDEITRDVDAQLAALGGLNQAEQEALEAAKRKADEWGANRADQMLKIYEASDVDMPSIQDNYEEIEDAAIRESLKSRANIEKEMVSKKMVAQEKLKILLNKRASEFTTFGKEMFEDTLELTDLATSAFTPEMMQTYNMLKRYEAAGDLTPKRKKRLAELRQNLKNMQTQRFLVETAQAAKEKAAGAVGGETLGEGRAYIHAEELGGINTRRKEAGMPLLQAGRQRLSGERVHELAQAGGVLSDSANLGGMLGVGGDVAGFVQDTILGGKRVGSMSSAEIATQATTKVQELVASGQELTADSLLKAVSDTIGGWDALVDQGEVKTIEEKAADFAGMGFKVSQKDIDNFQGYQAALEGFVLFTERGDIQTKLDPIIETVNQLKLAGQDPVAGQFYLGMAAFFYNASHLKKSHGAAIAQIGVGMESLLATVTTGEMEMIAGALSKIVQMPTGGGGAIAIEEARNAMIEWKKVSDHVNKFVNDTAEGSLFFKGGTIKQNVSQKTEVKLVMDGKVFGRAALEGLKATGKIDTAKVSPKTRWK